MSESQDAFVFIIRSSRLFLRSIVSRVKGAHTSQTLTACENLCSSCMKVKKITPVNANVFGLPQGMFAWTKCISDAGHRDQWDDGRPVEIALAGWSNRTGLPWTQSRCRSYFIILEASGITRHSVAETCPCLKAGLGSIPPAQSWSDNVTLLPLDNTFSGDWVFCLSTTYEQSIRMPEKSWLLKGKTGNAYLYGLLLWNY